jgi:RIO-like serine/threonine protein kinase
MVEPASQLSMLTGFYFDELEPRYAEVYKLMVAFWRAIQAGFEVPQPSDPSREAVLQQIMDAHEHLRLSCNDFQKALETLSKKYI